MPDAPFSAFVIPSAGQIYKRQWLKGLIIAVVFLVSSLGVLIPITLAVVNCYATINAALGQSDLSGVEQAIPNAFQLIREMAIPLVTLFVVSVVLYFYSIFDAYKFYQKQPPNRPSMES